jgi:hypothetical protein
LFYQYPYLLPAPLHYFETNVDIVLFYLEIFYYLKDKTFKYIKISKWMSYQKD